MIERGKAAGNRKRTEIIDFIRAYIARNSHPPVVREIGEACRLTPSTTSYHLKILRERGLVTWDPNLNRSLSLKGDA